MSRVTSSAMATFPNSRRAECRASFSVCPDKLKKKLDIPLLFQFARTRCLRVRQEANAPESLAAIPHCAASSAGGSISWCVLLLGRIQDSRNSCREPPPPRTLRHQLPLSRFGQVIDTQPWAKLRRLPFRGDPAFALKPVERR